MEIAVQKKIILESLDKSKVYIKEENFVELNGIETHVGNPHRKAFVNSIKGREELISYGLSDEYLNAVMAVWGDKAEVNPVPEEESKK